MSPPTFRTLVRTLLHPSLWPFLPQTCVPPLISLVTSLLKCQLTGSRDYLGCPLPHPGAWKRACPVIGARGIVAGPSWMSLQIPSRASSSPHPHPPPAFYALSFLSCHSPPHPPPHPTISAPPPFFLALLHTHREERTRILPAKRPLGPWCSCPAFTMAAFSALGLSPGCASRSLPLPSNGLTHACTHWSLLPSPSCPQLRPGGVTAPRSRPTLRGSRAAPQGPGWPRAPTFVFKLPIQRSLPFSKTFKFQNK